MAPESRPIQNVEILKRHFAAEYHEIRKQQRVLGDAGFNSANHADETTDMATALDNLA